MLDETQQNSKKYNHEELVRHFRWVKEMLDQKLQKDSDIATEEYKILCQLRDNWVDVKGIRIFHDLDLRYGKRAKQTVTSFLKSNIESDWAKIGEKEAKKGNEIADFIRVLWEPLLETGFEYQYQNNGNVVEFSVTRCPVFELAEQTGLHEWFYHMACMSDFFTTPSFSKEIGFVRTKTLIQGDRHCNHTYFSQSAITKDMRLGHCGLYCGNCPNYQKTVTSEPIHLDKDDSFEPCLGCRSNLKTKHCSNCTISRCNQSKSLRVCIECEEFPCTVMTDFIEDERYPYHRFVEENMKQLREIGLSQWVSSQRTKYTCGKCDTRLNFFQKQCHECNTPINL